MHYKCFDENFPLVHTEEFQDFSFSVKVIFSLNFVFSDRKGFIVF